MLLSVCIPVYNFDVRGLVSDLKKEISVNGLDAEIILIDDASDESFKNTHQILQNEVENFIFLEKNIGRSRIRNLFQKYASGKYLLFLDCDGKITEPDFLKNYTDFIQKHPETDVMYGGRIVSASAPDDEHYLRWKFSVERENLPLEFRLNKPYLSFQTNNFVIKKDIFEKVDFNPAFQKYGYEDLLFAMDLKSEHIKIDHISNPIFNNDLESNSVYLGKVEESIESLAAMLKDKNLAAKLSEVKLVRLYTKLPFKSLFGLILNGFTLKGLKKKLSKRGVNLRYLDVYKLGLLLKKMK
ncbi:glycosyltransferase family 2 protein [Chryseobacterium kwangjuense]|uniref:Glycosyl transferase family 2 n=1 Tax=Chryseobacterium kwangjuense TaxID=267125 RepID=A0A135WEI7_9FLAO|nr:glycosyltransferase [Chryseobacterium kwangjuense]KXH83333.1 glycosyl transferase family 2 [Chryseobacterium kwangjuense]